MGFFKRLLGGYLKKKNFFRKGGCVIVNVFGKWVLEYSL